MRSTMYQKSSILFAGNGAVKMSSVAYGFSPVKIDNSDYPKSFISRINEVFFFSIKYRYSIFFFKTFIVGCCNRLFRCNQTCYCAGIVSVTSTSRFRNP